MSTSAALHASISEEEYLSSSAYDRFEYESGVAYEKPMPDWNHAELCAWICFLLFKYFPQFGVGVEIRSRLKPERWRLPDLGVRRKETARERYAFTPLYLAIEILSEHDTPETMFGKCRQYHEWGVAFCWVLDGDKRNAWEFHQGMEPRSVDNALTAGEIRLSVAEIFSHLDT